jgi:geranylgeranyl pyrophosphate synthase
MAIEIDNLLSELCSPHARFLDPSTLGELLSLRFGGDVGDYLSSVALNPLNDLVGRPSKKIRGRLVEIGFDITCQHPINFAEGKIQCQRLLDAIEYLHAGSLAIDDLQDGSKMRRGQPSLHLKYGLPIALNVGNWLYFWPLEIVKNMNLPPEKELQIYRIYHRTLLRAHLGQALDVGLPIDTVPQERVADLCLSTMELKSGALFSLGLLMGSVIGEASTDLMSAIDRFGHGFGIGLQMFDDIGNLKSVKEPAKRWEDLVLRRPTWVWAVAAKYYSPESYLQFISAVHQLSHDHNPLLTWFDHHDFIHKAKQLAHQHLESCYAELGTELLEKNRSPEPLTRLRKLGLEISEAYG